MAIIKRGILGGFSNKIGNIVGTSWKGIAIMKSLPLSVANPRTAAQVGQRTKFTSVVAVASGALGGAVKPLNDRFAQQQSGYNLFIQRNIDNYDSNGNIISPESLIMGEGKLSKEVSFNVTDGIGARAIVVNTIVVGSSAFNLPSDRYILTVIGPDNTSVFFANDIGQVGATSYNVTLGENPGPGIYDVYLNRRSVDGTNVGGTTHSTWSAPV